MEIAKDLNHYFVTSEQVPTRVALDLKKHGDEVLGVVAGVLVQALPDGDVAALERLELNLPARSRRSTRRGCW